MHPIVRPLRGTLVSAMLLLGGCGFETRPEDSTGLYGPWRWIGSSGGIVGIHPTPDDEEIELIFYFHRSGMVTIYARDSAPSHIPYEASPTPPAGRPGHQRLRYAHPVEAFPFDPGIDSHIVQRADADTLVLADPCCHRYEHTFVRIE